MEETIEEEDSMAKRKKKTFLVDNKTKVEGGIYKRGVGIFFSEEDIMNDEYSEFFWEESFDYSLGEWKPVKTVRYASSLLASMKRLQDLGYEIVIFHLSESKEGKCSVMNLKAKVFNESNYNDQIVISRLVWTAIMSMHMDMFLTEPDM